MKSRALRISGIVGGILLLAAAGLVWTQRHYLQDSFIAAQFQPSAAVRQLTEDMKLTDEGKRYFYASQPEVHDAAAFNAHCERAEEQSAILGCYRNNHIYIYAITNPELAGIQQVTAAHEMLHAAWERLPTREQDRLGTLLEAAYQSVKTADLETRMEYYARAQPGERSNELHSILGTESSALGPELEAHYGRVFSDRQAVVGLYQNYAGVFSSLKKEADELKRVITAEAANVAQQSSEYNAAVGTLNADIAQLNGQLSQVDRTNSAAVSSFNARRQQLMQRSAALEQTKREINQRVQEYNAQVARYNTLVVHSEQLTQSIDSTLRPSPTL